MTDVPGRGDPRAPAQRYLAVATDLARRGGADAWANLTSQIPLTDVADELEVSRTALYRHWPTRHAFWTDLSAYLALGNDFVQPEPALPWNQRLRALDALDEATSEPLEVIRTMMNDLQDVVLADVWVVVRAAQLAFAEMPDLARTRERIEQDRIGHLTRQVTERMQKHSLGVAPPASERDVAVTMWCVTDGLGVLNWYLPDVSSQRLLLDDGAGPRPWSLLGFAYRALLLEMSVPDARSVAPAPPQTSSGPDAVAMPAISDTWNERQRAALAVGTSLLLERLVAETPTARLEVLGHVTVDRIARAAGVSRRAIYDVWPSRDDLVLDLLGTLLDGDARRMRAAFDAAAGTRATVAARPTLGHVVDALLFDGRDGGPASATPTGSAPSRDLEQAVLAALPQAHRPPINAILRERHERLVDVLVEPVRSLVCADGSRLRDDVTIEHLTLTLLALMEGARRILRSNPAVVRLPGRATRSTFGMAADALASSSVVR